MKYKAVLFDFDNTIIHSNLDYVKASIITAKKFGIKLNTTKISRMMGMSVGDIIKKLLPKITKEEFNKLIKYREKIYKEISTNKKVKTIDGIENLLKFLKKNKIKIGIVSSSSRKGINLNIKKTKLKKYFDIIIASDDTKKHKPNPDPLILAMKKLKLKPKDCIYIGDSKFDMISAKNAKILPIGIYTGFYSANELKKHGGKFAFKNHKSIFTLLKSWQI